jgi:hypothetical protein
MRDYLMRIGAPVYILNKILASQTPQLLLHAIEQDTAKFINIHLVEYTQQGLLVRTFH